MKIIAKMFRGGSRESAPGTSRIELCNFLKCFPFQILVGNRRCRLKVPVGDVLGYSRPNSKGQKRGACDNRILLEANYPPGTTANRQRAGRGQRVGRIDPRQPSLAAESAAGRFATSDVLRGSHRADEGPDVRHPAGDNQAPRQYLSAFRPRWKHGGSERPGRKSSG